MQVIKSMRRPVQHTVFGYFISDQDAETAVAGISEDYTNAVQLKAQYTILVQRQQLKFAALDTWQLVAKSLPAGLTVQRFNFTDGKKLNLSGLCTLDQMNEVTGSGQFYDSLRKATDTNGQAIFNQNPDVGDQIQITARADKDFWNFGLELMRSEGGP